MPRILQTSLRKPVLRSKPRRKKILKPYSNTISRVSQVRAELTRLLKGKGLERFSAIGRLKIMYSNGEISAEEVFPHLAKVIFSDKSDTNRTQAAILLEAMDYKPALKLFKRAMDPAREKSSDVRTIAVRALTELFTNKQERKELIAFFEKAYEKETDFFVKNYIQYMIEKLK